jgi:hypothetical protein
MATRDGSVGRETYQAVNKLVDGGKSRTEAIAAVAAERKQQEGTVSANYYRVARAQGKTPGRPATRSRPAAATKPTPAPAARTRSTNSVGDQLAALIQEMVDRAVDERIKRLLT